MKIRNVVGILILVTGGAFQQIVAQENIIGGVSVLDPRPCKLSAEYDNWILYGFSEFEFCAPADLSIKPKWGEVLFMEYKTKKVTFTAGLLYNKSWNTSEKGVSNVQKTVTNENKMEVTRFLFEVTSNNQFPYSYWYTAYFLPTDAKAKTSFYITFGGDGSLGEVPEKIFQSVRYLPNSSKNRKAYDDGKRGSRKESTKDGKDGVRKTGSGTAILQ